MIETCVVYSSFAMPYTYVCASVLFYPILFCSVCYLYCSFIALLFPCYSLSIAGKCKQIRKQSLATFSDLTCARTKVCYKNMMRSVKRDALLSSTHIYKCMYVCDCKKTHKNCSLRSVAIVLASNCIRE